MIVRIVLGPSDWEGVVKLIRITSTISFTIITTTVVIIWVVVVASVTRTSVETFVVVETSTVASVSLVTLLLLSRSGDGVVVQKYL